MTQIVTQPSSGPPTGDYTPKSGVDQNKYNSILNLLQSSGYASSLDALIGGGPSTGTSSAIINDNITTTDPTTGASVTITAGGSSNGAAPNSPVLQIPDDTTANGDLGMGNPWMQVSYIAVLAAILAEVAQSNIAGGLSSLLDKAKTMMTDMSLSWSQGTYDENTYNLQAADLRSQAITLFAQAGVSIASGAISIGQAGLGPATSKYEDDLENLQDNPECTESDTQAYMDKLGAVDTAKASYASARENALSPEDKNDVDLLSTSISDDKTFIAQKQKELDTLERDPGSTEEQISAVKTEISQRQTVLDAHVQAKAQIEDTVSDNTDVIAAKTAYTQAKKDLADVDPQPGLQQLTDFRDKLIANQPATVTPAGSPPPPDTPEIAAAKQAVTDKEAQISSFKNNRDSIIANNNQLLSTVNTQFTQGLNQMLDGVQKMLSANYTSQEGQQKYLSDITAGLQKMVDALASSTDTVIKSFGDALSSFLQALQQLEQSNAQNFIHQ